MPESLVQVPPLEVQRRTAAQELLRARGMACAAGHAAEFDHLTTQITVARWRLAAATDPAEQDRHLSHVTKLAQRRCDLVSPPVPRDAAPNVPDVTARALSR